ncbi:isocitrate lyase/phosphoenolpyruvate mutase family protein [Glutamicibacter sp.]|uniref:isocitrate lyase/PEP mutase family protein n=1 Tax=Glutamicibacter sp. TaxID=1931995 RepID=UPI0028BDAC41|nr:isocitrate lyase/phosphoenolpyruvate mutase family protein [Glutamicibacter sp.]
MAGLLSRTEELAQEHASGKLLVMPTVWDVFSANVAAEAGFSLLTIGSHPVADSIGSQDGEKMDFAQYLGIARRIVDAVGLPVSVDVESGYGLAPDELINRLLEAGASGANIEDSVHGEGGRLRERSEHADYIAAARQAADEAGVPFVINGRTDAVKAGTSMFADPLEEAIARIKLMEQAGARSVYPVALNSADQVAAVVQAVNVPVNVTAHPVTGHGAGDLPALKQLGVRRVSFGPLWQKWLAEVSANQLVSWLSPA